MRADIANFQEVSAEQGFALQNERMLKVALQGNEINAKLGSMVAYQGELNFEHAGSGGLKRMMKKMSSGEGQKLMTISGQGDVFLADQANNIHLIYLEGEALTVNGPQLLAFDSEVDWDINTISGGVAGMFAGGLFNTTLQGTGFVAVLSDGPPVLLNTGPEPTFTDSQATIAWSAGLQTELRTDVSAKTFLGRGSGESLQLGFSGSGWVLVQPSEGPPPAPAGRSGSGTSISIG